MCLQPATTRWNGRGRDAHPGAILKRGLKDMASFGLVPRRAREGDREGDREGGTGRFKGDALAYKRE